MYKKYLSDKGKNQVAIIVQLLMCVVQFFLLIETDFTGSILNVALHTWFIFIVPTVTLLIIRFTLGKEVAAAGAFLPYIISMLTIFVAVIININNPDAVFNDPADTIFIPFAKLTIVYVIIGFLPSLIMTSVSTAKEKELEENKLQ